MRNNNYMMAGKGYYLTYLNPVALLDYVVKKGDVIVVDKQKLKSQFNEQQQKIIDIQLFKLLAHVYNWNYKDFDDMTIYFDQKDKVLLGGVYNIHTTCKLTEVELSAIDGDPSSYPYIFTEAEWGRVIDALTCCP